MYKAWIIKHKGENRIAVSFEKKAELITRFKKLNDAKWSTTLKTWHLPDTADNRLKFKLPVEVSLSVEAEKQIQKFVRWLKSRRYSENTIKAYTDTVRIFLLFFAKKAISEIDHSDIIHFNNAYILKNKLSSSYQNQFVNALKLFSQIADNRQIHVHLILRPKREKRLPHVLSKQEVKAILNAPVNLKHCVMLSLIYACGLRRSELLNLRPSDILSDRHLLHIYQSKGKKDRVVPISENTIEMLRRYYKVYRPKYWLFEGQEAGRPYSPKSLQNVLKRSLIKAKIAKPVTLHWLRHSYATHLLENGTDIRYIQELLGHNSSRTTEIYTHVSNRDIQKIISPFDLL